MPDLYLRKVRHDQAGDNYRVIMVDHDEEIEIGSIGVTTFTSTDIAWTWGIDTVLPMREYESEGRGADRKDCMAKFRAVWERHCRNPGWLDEFLKMKRQARRA